MHALSTAHAMSKITQLAISQKLIDQNKKKKFCSEEYIFTPLDLKIKIQMAENLCVTFLTSVKSTLNTPPNSP